MKPLDMTQYTVYENQLSALNECHDALAVVWREMGRDSKFSSVLSLVLHVMGEQLDMIQDQERRDAEERG